MTSGAASSWIDRGERKQEETKKEDKVTFLAPYPEAPPPNPLYISPQRFSLSPYLFFFFKISVSGPTTERQDLVLTEA